MPYVYEASDFVWESELDANGFWKPVEVFRRMQNIAGLHATQMGVGRETTIENQVVWVLLRAKLEILRPLAGGENITITTWPTPCMRTVFPRHYAICDRSGVRVMQATTVWTLLDLQNRAMVGPDAAGIQMPDLSGQPEGFPQPGALSRPLEDGQTVERMVRYSDVDLNGHMNNTRYVEWALDLMPPSWIGQKRISCVQVNYISEARAGDTLRMSWREEEGGFRVKGHVPGRPADVFHAWVGLG